MTHADPISLCDRARRIALRIAPWPEGEAFNGFYHREAFIARCRMMDRHNRVYREVFARLAEKAAAEREQPIELKQTGTGYWV